MEETVDSNDSNGPDTYEFTFQFVMGLFFGSGSMRPP